MDVSDDLKFKMIGFLVLGPEIFRYWKERVCKYGDSCLQILPTTFSREVGRCGGRNGGVSRNL